MRAAYRINTAPTTVSDFFILWHPKEGLPKQAHPGGKIASMTTDGT